MERIVAKNGVVFYRSELIPTAHGFSTRLGGVSLLPHTKELNLGFSRGDDEDTVLENLERFSSAVGVDAESIISVTQIHSDKIRTVDINNIGEGYFVSECDACDGYITEAPGVTVGVKTADCVPILLYAPPADGFGGAVSAVHSGWRGTALAIAAKAIERLVGLGANKNNIIAAIGPSIGGCCYTVKKDFYESFLNAAGKELTERFVLPVSDGIWRVDLKSVNKQTLIDCGLNEENIDVSDACTCCMNEEFYSHRAMNGIRGTMLSVISMNEVSYE